LDSTELRVNRGAWREVKMEEKVGKQNKEKRKEKKERKERKTIFILSH
jgi:hypothetical protein